MRYLIRTGLLIAATWSAAVSYAQEPVSEQDLLNLKNRMTGYFNSGAQASRDSSYFKIDLHMVPVWTSRNDGYWLYVEQAMNAQPAKPYRQRIYHLYRQDATTLVSKVYEFPAPASYIGSWSDPSKFNSLTPDSLIDRQGCAIFLLKNKDGDFHGATDGKKCLSNLRGASYATSEVVIRFDRMVSWDRGWDAGDKQVWGAVKGGYEFIKQ